MLTLTISLPITDSFRQIARQFASEQPNDRKAKQVYVNTLAVEVVNSYLQMLDIPTELKASYCWNAVGRLCADVADLKLTGLGHLECRSIAVNEANCYIPPEVWDDRIGYVVVEFDHDYREGKILGFVPHIVRSLLSIEALQSIDQFLIHLQKFKPLVRLSRWLDGAIEPGWQTVTELISNQNGDRKLASRLYPAALYRGKYEYYLETYYENIKQKIKQLYPNPQQRQEIELIPPIRSQLINPLVDLVQTTEDEETRWKAAEMLWTIDPDHPTAGVRRVMDLGMQLAGHAIALMVSILPKSAQEIAVLLRLYPMGNQAHLPSGLQLSVVDEDDNSVIAIQSRNYDDYIQLKIIAESQEQFNVKISIDNTTIAQHFVV